MRKNPAVAKGYGGHRAELSKTKERERREREKARDLQIHARREEKYGNLLDKVASRAEEKNREDRQEDDASGRRHPNSLRKW